MNNVLNWLGSFSQGQGYSGSSEQMAVALEKNGLDVRVMTFSSGLKRNMTEEGRKLIEKPFQVGKWGICYGIPSSFTSLMFQKYKIGFTMFETDTIPHSSFPNEWAGKTGKAKDIINKLDMLLVPSQHNKLVFQKEGITIPIEVVNLGVDTKMYPKIIRPKRKTFTFLILGTLTIRKNVGALLSAFIELFKDNPDVKLVIKTTSGTIGHLNFPWKNIEIIDSYATPEETLELYKRADCFVFPSRGEGFGLPPLEAMSTGLPVIFSANTGMLEYAHNQFNYPVPISHKAKAVRFPKKWGNVGNWYEIDYKALKEMMKYVYENREEAYFKGLDAAEWVRQRFTYDQTAKRIISLLTKHFP